MFLEAIPMLLNGNKKVFLLLCSIKLFCVFFLFPTMFWIVFQFLKLIKV